MFIYDFKNNILPDINSFKNNITIEKLLLESQINNQINIKNKIFDVFINFITININNLENYTNIQDFNDSFKLSEYNYNNLNTLKKYLLDIFQYIESTDFSNEYYNQQTFLIELQEKLNTYYNLKNKIQKNVLNNTETLERTIKNKNTENKTTLTIKNKPSIAETEKSDKQDSAQELITPTTIDLFTNSPTLKEKNTETEKEKTQDNHLLLISEKENKVYLPYLISDLEEKIKNNSQYNSIEDVINSEYIIPLNTLKSSAITRFKEAFKLIKNKEKGSFKESCILGLELMNNYKLNPAVISACRTEDELDIYLDCLSENELDNFEIFDIKFEITPVKT